MNNTLLRQLLIDEEGIDLNAHQVQGIWHIGIGHNLEIDQTDEELDILGDYTDPSRLKLTEEEAFALFDLDVQDAIDDVYPAFTVEELQELGETRRAVILSMVFQCGGAGFRKFKKFIAAVKAFDWTTASCEMLDSRAARQTPQRWQRASDAMQLGYFEKYQRPTVRTQRSESTEESSALSTFSSEALLQELILRETKKK